MTTTSLPAGAGTAAVPGGDLAFAVHPGSTHPVLAIHGVSSQRKLWAWLRAQAPEVTVIAPDLRGRADSVGVPGPFGLARHADDLVAVLDRLGVDRVHVIGMSMGGFVGVQLAAAHPDRVLTLTLVDGGPPLELPAGVTRELVPTIFADRIGRLGHRWASLDEYVAFVVDSTAPLLDPADPLLRENLAHDLVDGRVRLSPEALLADARDVFFGAHRWSELTLPIRMTCAEWGAAPGAAPAYSPEAVDRLRERLVRVERLPGLDHAATIMTPGGAAAAATLLREAIG
jgi:pimeloyl-ACP methyl ester carboxylesterase